MNWDRYLEIVGTWEKVCVDPKGFNSLAFDTPVARYGACLNIEIL